VIVSRPGASEGASIGSKDGSVDVPFVLSGRLRITRRTLLPLVTWVQPFSSVTSVLFCGLLVRRDVLGIVRIRMKF
jgi:hypothetical protein